MWTPGNAANWPVQVPGGCSHWSLEVQTLFSVQGRTSHCWHFLFVCTAQKSHRTVLGAAADGLPRSVPSMDIANSSDFKYKHLPTCKFRPVPTHSAISLLSSHPAPALLVCCEAETETETHPSQTHLSLAVDPPPKQQHIMARGHKDC